MRFFFHFKDGETVLDEEGVELDGIEAAKSEAVLSCGEMIRDISSHGSFWTGEPWQMWVTGTPGGEGTVFIRLNFTGFAISS